jgi:hypothetical protein
VSWQIFKLLSGHVEGVKNSNGSGRKCGKERKERRSVIGLEKRSNIIEVRVGILGTVITGFLST